MTGIAPLLIADHLHILEQIDICAHDPSAWDAAHRFISIIDSIAIHARFVDVVVAPLIAPCPACDAALSHPAFLRHRSVMSLMEALRQAVSTGQFWTMNLGVLTDVVWPHVVLRDHLILSELRHVLSATALEDVGSIFISVMDEFWASVRRPRRFATAARSAHRDGRRIGRGGNYPAHHPGPARPWQARPMRERSGHGSLRR